MTQLESGPIDPIHSHPQFFFFFSIYHFLGFCLFAITNPNYKRGTGAGGPKRGGLNVRWHEQLGSKKRIFFLIFIFLYCWLISDRSNNEMGGEEQRAMNA